MAAMRRSPLRSRPCHRNQQLSLSQALCRQLRTLLHSLTRSEASEEVATIGVRLGAQAVKSQEAFANWLRLEVPGEDWYFAVARTDDDQLLGYAMPGRQGLAPMHYAIQAFPYVEVHSLLVAWWLTTSWRVRQLVDASTALLETSQMIPAATCVRALVETAAAFWVDATKVARAWGEAKRHGGPERDSEANRRRSAMMTIINEVLMGSKFDDRSPDLLATWGKVKRGNVLGSVEKLSKAIDGSLQDDYQWLCNTVHPSLGNAIFFGALNERHDTGTHLLTHFFGHPSDVARSSGTRRDVDEAVFNALASSTLVLRTCMDAALHVVDDLGLTTRAGSMSAFQYWRNFPGRDRKVPCPCRSGRRPSRCFHEWGDDCPAIPSSFK